MFVVIVGGAWYGHLADLLPTASTISGDAVTCGLSFFCDIPGARNEPICFASDTKVIAMISHGSVDVRYDFYS